jgi:choline dehydrogenase-like flavoprotein
MRINVPGLRGSTLGSVYDWNFTTTAQTALGGRQIDVPRGKVLGGTSALNYLCYDRAAVAEYDSWATVGNKGWDFKTMIAAMLKTETYTGPNDGDIHGTTGPIKNAYNRFIPKIYDTWKPTMNRLGVATTNGSMGGSPIGVSFQPTNIDTTNYTRSYSASAYLPLAGKNLEIKVNTRVAKVEFEMIEPGQPLKAIGVILDDGSLVAASKEVILSAGAVQTPGLLENSGIGQAKVLKAANITQYLELPGVGENFQDHPRISNSYKLKPENGKESVDPLIYDNQGAYASEQMALRLAGKPSWMDVTSTAYAFVNWKQIVGNDTALVDLAKANAGHAIDKAKLSYLADPTIPQVELVMENNYVGEKGYTNGSHLTIIATLMHPMSRGSVHVDPRAPRGKPVIDPAYLTHAHDVRALAESAKFARRIAETEPMRGLWTAEYEPGAETKTDEDWVAFARKAMLSFFHPVGTAAMLPEKDGGVVSDRLVVHGTRNLRVVDASVFPVMLSGHPQTAVYGIAEIAADMIIKGNM